MKFYTGENINQVKKRYVCIKTHGKSKTYTYKVWRSIVTRCTNKKLKRYCDWGGRGVGICESWLFFENFLNDMGEVKKEDNLELDRINNNLGYCKENCRWTSPSVNSANRRRIKRELPRGVYQRNGKYRAILRTYGFNYTIGTYLTIEEAKKKYDEVAFEWWGNRANLDND